jgi:hypothetical protein
VCGFESRRTLRWRRPLGPTRRGAGAAAQSARIHHNEKTAIEQVQAKRFIDLAQPEPDDASPRLQQRRSLLRAAGLAAFAASATGSAFAQAMDRYSPDAPPIRYP